jgi:magnesium chelatase accessory protein
LIHIEGTLAMMANWDLDNMASQIRELDIPMLQIIGDKDGTIEPSASLKTAKLLANGDREVFEGYGHLVHEEAPQEVGASIRRFYGSMA